MSKVALRHRRWDRHWTYCNKLYFEPGVILMDEDNPATCLECLANDKEPSGAWFERQPGIRLADSR